MTEPDGMAGTRRVARVTDVVLGLDLSLTATGWAALGRDGSLCNSGILKSDKRGTARLDDLSRQLGTVLDWCAPVLAVIEGYAYGARGAAVWEIGEWGGVARLECYRRRVPLAIVAPAAAKKFATGRGAAQKDAIRLAAYKRWGVEFNTSDETDAYVLARIGLALAAQRRGEPPELLAYEREALKSVLGKDA